MTGKVVAVKQDGVRDCVCVCERERKKEGLTEGEGEKVKVSAFAAPTPPSPHTSTPPCFSTATNQSELSHRWHYATTLITRTQNTVKTILIGN